MCACVCVCCSRCSQYALRETSEEIRGDKQSPLFPFCHSFCLFYSLSVSPSPGVSLWLPVSCREETNDGSMSAQSAVTETFLNLSFPPSHPVQLLSPCLSPPTHAFPFFHHYIYPSASSIHSVPAVMSTLRLSPFFSPSSSSALPMSACGVMIALGWFGSGPLPATFHTSLGNDWNTRCRFPCG